MKKSIVGVLMLGIVSTTVVARADEHIPAPNGATEASESSQSVRGPICWDLNNSSLGDAVQRLSKLIGTEVRVQGPSFARVSVKLNAKTADEAVAQLAAAANAHWQRAFIFGAGSLIAQPGVAEPALTVTFRSASASSAAYLAAARVGGIVILEKPLTGKVSFEGKNVPVGMVMDAIGSAAGTSWKFAYVLQTAPTVLAGRVGTSGAGGFRSELRQRPDSPLAHIHREGGRSIIQPAPGSIVTDPAAETARLEAEAMRRQVLGEWAGVFTQESPKETKRAIRDLRIRVETAIQKLESYPPQNRHLGVAMWRARYERMLEDYKSLTPDQQKQVQPVLDAMKYFAAPTPTN